MLQNFLNFKITPQTLEGLDSNYPCMQNRRNNRFTILSLATKLMAEAPNLFAILDNKTAKVVTPFKKTTSFPDMQVFLETYQWQVLE